MRCQAGQPAEQTEQTLFVFANPLGFALIKGFKVIGEDLCPTHSTVSFLIDMQCLATLVNDAFQLQHGTPPVPVEDCHILDPDAVDSDGKATAPLPIIKQLVANDFKTVAVDFALKEDQFIGNLKNYMDSCFVARCQSLRDFLYEGEIDSFCQGWGIVEQSIVSFAAVGGAHPLHSHCGRGNGLVRLEVVN